MVRVDIASARSLDAERRKFHDSSDDEDDSEPEERLSDRRSKRNKRVHSSAQYAPATSHPPTTLGKDSPAPPGSVWVPGHYEQTQPEASSPLIRGPSAQRGLCDSENIEDRLARRKRKKDYDLSCKQRATAGKKPNRVYVLEGGEVDGRSEGKNAWDECLRDLVPKCLDMSVVSWKKHQPHTLRKLRAALDNEFEYVGNPLSMTGFRIAVTKYMKSERSRLKARFVKGDVSPPEHIDSPEWERLKEYWNTDAQKLKSANMVKARNQVKDGAKVGRKIKSRTSAVLVSFH